MAFFDFLRRKKKKGKSSSSRREPKFISISGEGGGAARGSGGSKKGKKKSQGRKWYWTALRKLFLPCTVLLALFAFYIWYDLPDIGLIGDVKKTPSITLRTEDGTIIGSYGDVYGDFITYDQLPPDLVNAVVATEDRNFFHHFGIDPFGMLRAVFVNLRAKKLVQGGSTITQQLAKNAFLTPDRTLKRKLQEMILAVELERRYSKKDILAMYLNRVYMGAGNYGVDAASQRYFGHHVQQISLNEAAMLVGLLKAPTRYAPTTNPDLSEKRGTQVILNMQDAGYLTQKQVDEARKSFEDEDALYRDTQGFGVYYFNDFVMGQITDLLGEVKQDIIVTTTLLPDKQRLAEEAVSSELAKKGAALKAQQASLLSMTPDGAIRAMVGGRNYRASQFNRVTQALRQPGSSFKLFVYLAALEAGYTPETEMEDRPISVGKWQPRDYTGKYQGRMTLRNALAQSINSIAVQLSEAVGRNRVIDMAQRLGISEAIDPNPSLALGTSEVTLLEMTTAYAHVAANGNYVHPFAIQKIETTTGRVLFEHRYSEEAKALRPETVEMMNSMLLAVTAYGTGKGALIGRPVAGKTGTASDYRDAWFIGFVPQLVTGVWVGNDDTSPMKKVTGGSLPAAIFKDYMLGALKNVAVADIPSRSSAGGLFSLPWLSSSAPPAPRPYTPRDQQRPPENANAGNANYGNPFAIVDKEESGATEQPAPRYEPPPTFWDKLVGGNE